MKFRKVAILFSMFILYCFQSAAAGIDEYWHSHSLIHKMPQGWNVKVRLDYRYKQDGLYIHYSEYGISHSVLKFVSLSLNYRHVYQKSCEFSLERRPNFNITCLLSKKRLKFKNRIQFECRIKEIEQFWRYREKLGVEVKTNIQKQVVKPFVEYEIFWDTRMDEVNKNWLIAGIRLPFNRFQLNLFLNRQSVKNKGDWHKDFITGAYFSYYL